MLSRIKLVIFVSVLGVVCPHPLFAQQEQPSGLRLPTAAFGAAAVADWATTYHGLKNFRLRETNPLIRRFDRTPAKMVLIGGAIDVGAVAAWNYSMGKKHPRVAAAGLWTMTAFRTVLAIHNMRNQRATTRR